MMLREVAKELGGSIPKYNDATLTDEGTEYEVQFNVPTRSGGHVTVKGFGCAFDKSLRRHMQNCANAQRMKLYS